MIFIFNGVLYRSINHILFRFGFKNNVKIDFGSEFKEKIIHVAYKKEKINISRTKKNPDQFIFKCLFRSASKWHDSSSNNIAP